MNKAWNVADGQPRYREVEWSTCKRLGPHARNSDGNGLDSALQLLWVSSARVMLTEAVAETDPSVLLDS